MAIDADTTAESLTGKNDLKKNSSVVQSSSNKKSRIREHPFMIEFITSGLSVSVANVVTLPIEVIKVRLQLANPAMTTSKSTMKAGLLETTRKVYHKEGIRAFYSGLMPAIVRGLFYGGVRLGAYGPIKNILKNLVTDDSQATVKFIRNITAGCLSGTIAAVASNPVDLCKTKLQTKNSPYTSSIHVIKDVIKHHGVKGLWVGTVPAAIRTAALTAAQCVTYDHAKRFWMRVTGWSEGIKLHLGASLITGLVTTTVTAPLDMIKTNMYASGDYGVIELTNKVVHKEGIQGLLRGWSAAYVRLGPQTVVIFLVMEKLRQFSGLSAL
jgi:solute carrier family 25 uncoupling protein 8/9